MVKRVCAERGVPLTCVDFSNLEPLEDPGGPALPLGRRSTASLLLGRHQLHNAAVVLETVWPP